MSNAIHPIHVPGYIFDFILDFFYPFLYCHVFDCLCNMVGDVTI